MDLFDLVGVRERFDLAVCICHNLFCCDSNLVFDWKKQFVLKVALTSRPKLWIADKLKETIGLFGLVLLSFLISIPISIRINAGFLVIPLELFLRSNSYL